jgi:hypothetical protein
MSTLVTGLVVIGAIYAAACAVWPYKACYWCDGGKRKSPSGKSWRSCHWCSGSGQRPRLGRRLWHRTGQ